jgi:hypothetical protein
LSITEVTTKATVSSNDGNGGGDGKPGDGKSKVPDTVTACKTPKSHLDPRTP